MIKTKTAKKCLSCASSRFVYPPVQLVRKMVNDKNYSYASRKIGVSDNAIRKFLKKKKDIVEETTQDIWRDCLNCDRLFETSRSSFDKLCSQKCHEDKKI